MILTRGKSQRNSSLETEEHPIKATLGGAVYYLNSLRYSLGVRPVILRKATLNELVWA
jgi:hypothetical protein